MEKLLRVIWLEAKYQTKRLIRKLTYGDYEADLQFTLNAEHNRRKYRKY